MLSWTLEEGWTNSFWSNVNPRCVYGRRPSQPGRVGDRGLDGAAGVQLAQTISIVGAGRGRRGGQPKHHALQLCVCVCVCDPILQ